MSRPRTLSASKFSTFSKPRQVVYSNIKTNPIYAASLTFMRPPKTRSKNISQESPQKEVQLWELTQEVKKLEEQHKSFVKNFETQNESSSILRTNGELDEIKRERDELYELKIKDQKHIENLEEQIKKMTESYENEVKNMNEYIALLRRKFEKNSGSLSNSPQISRVDKSNNFEELYLREKEKSGLLQDTLKNKEKEYESIHRRNSSESVASRIEQLTYENNSYRSALAEAESDIKRLYMEIKHQNEQIFQQKQKIEIYESKKDMMHSYEFEDLKFKLKKCSEEKKELEEEWKKNQLKSNDLEKIISELGKSLLTMTRELESRNSEYQNLESEFERLKENINPAENTEKAKETKEECMLMIKTAANEMNQQISDIMYKVEQTENELNKIINFVKGFGSRIDQNIKNKSIKNEEALKREVQRLSKEKEDLKQKLEAESAKRLKEIASYEDETNKLRSSLREKAKDYESQVLNHQKKIHNLEQQNKKIKSSGGLENEKLKLEQDNKQLIADLESLNIEYESLYKINEENKDEIGTLKSMIAILEKKLKDAQVELKPKTVFESKQDEILKNITGDNNKRIKSLEEENKQLNSQIQALNLELDKASINIDELNEKLKESNERFAEKAIEVEEINKLYDGLAIKTEEVLKEQLKVKTDSQKIKNDFEDEKIKLQIALDNVVDEKNQQIIILQNAIKDQQEAFEQKLSELKWENGQENLITELEEKIKTLKNEYFDLMQRNEKELKESFTKEISKLKASYEASYDKLMENYLDLKKKYDKNVDDLKTLENLRETLSATQYKLWDREKEIDKLKEELFEVDEKMEDLEKYQSDQLQEVIEYEKILKSKEKEIFELHIELDALKQKENSNSIIDEYTDNTKLAEINIQLDDLTKENISLKEQLKKQFSETEIANLHSQISNLRQNLEKTQKDLLRKSELEEELKILQEKCKNKGQKLTALKNACSELEVVNSSLRTSKILFENEAAKKEKIIKDMQREFGSQNVEVNKAKQRADQFEALYNSLYTEMEEKNKRIEILERDLQSIGNKGLFKGGKLKMEANESVSILGKKMNENEENEKLKQKVNLLTDDIDILLDNEEKYKLIIEDLKQRQGTEFNAEDAKVQFENLEAQLEDLQYRYDQLLEEHEELIKNEKNKQDTSQEETSMQIQILSEQLDQIIREKNDLELEIDTLRELHGKDEKVKHYQQQAENLAKICTELEKEREEPNKVYKENLKKIEEKYEEFLKQRLDEIADQFDELQEKANNYAIENEDLRTELEAEKEKNVILEQELYKYSQKNKNN
ncbi:unnamed protein product [Blepharisma stoltei]|uniref:Uncharacterized protein n=1 Tax=Blepharisma stoltei TaxID=1481888 RepID=A0AAU9JBL0_9CILI|nr:unnamed protein product [Blepharisma stoltei]